MSPSLRWAEAEAVARGIARQFVSPGLSIFWGYLASAAVIAALVVLVRRRTARGLLAQLAPREVWLRRSTLNDALLLVGNTLIYSFWLLAPLSWISTTLAEKTWLGLHTSLGPLAEPLAGTGAMAALALALFVVADLGFFLGHYAMHRIPLLWEFHKVHHSAPVLQPLTVLRRHPVSIAFDGVVSGLLLGPVYGLAGWLGGGQLGPLTILGVNALLFIGLAAGFNLQHSHVWLSFGPLDRWLISPATHQLHHSAEPDHYDRNFGNFLAVWDRLAGSLLTPAQARAGAHAKGQELPPLRFGLGPAGGAWERDYASAWRLYLIPFVGAGRLLVGAALRLARRARAR